MLFNTSSLVSRIKIYKRKTEPIIQNEKQAVKYENNREKPQDI